MRQEYFGVLDLTVDPCIFEPSHLQESMYGMVTVDEKKIDQVCYANTRSGVVKTYAVLPNGKTTSARGFNPYDFPGRDVTCTLYGVLTETLRGKVRIFGPEQATS